jgi:hypothetical protein
MAADAFLVFDPTFEPIIEHYLRDPCREVLGQLESLPGLRNGKLNFTHELVGSGVVGTAPFFSDLWKGCGFEETIIESTSVAYQVASLDIPSLTLAKYIAGNTTDALIKTIWGARGNWRLVLENGKPGLVTLEFTGADFSITDGTLLSGVSYSSVKPPVFQGATFTWDSYEAVISRLEINLQNEVNLRPSVAEASGYISAIITNRNPQATFDPEAVLVATKDFFGAWRDSGGAGALACSLGETAGNIISISAPKCQIAEIKMGDRIGLRTLEVTAGLRMNTGDDEIVITLT